MIYERFEVLTAKHEALRHTQTFLLSRNYFSVNAMP